MKGIELQSKTGLLSQFNNNFYSTSSSKARKKKIIIISSISLIVLICIIIIIVVATSSSSESNQEQTPKGEENKEIKKENFYSERTKSYLNLIENLSKTNTILYHWNLELDSDNKVIFKNKYQSLYNYSTDLKPLNSSIGHHLYQVENYRTIDTELSKYYKEINQKKPDHLVYGPSINGKEYAKAQSLYSDEIKLGGKKDKKIYSISFNIKKGKNQGNSNSCNLFGFNTENNKKGISVTISWGVVYFKAGNYNGGYTYEDSVKLGYKDNDPYTKYLSFRPFYDDRWHHIAIIQKILDEEDLKYIEGKKVGDVMGEYFLDGMSRKNFTGGLMDDYGNLTVFDFAEEEDKIHNDNWFIDEMMVFEKRLTPNEVNTLYNIIDQEAEKIVPKVDSQICKIPGAVCGPLPSDLCPESEEKLVPEVKLFHFTNKWTCLGFNFNNFIYDRITEFCGDNLRLVDWNIAEGKKAKWTSEFHYRYSVLDISTHYLPNITSIFTNLTSFSDYVTISSTNSNGKDKKYHKMINYGYWISTEGVWNLPKYYEKLSDNETVRTNAALMNYFAYFELDEPYELNRIYTIDIKNSPSINFVYDDKIISYAIKINQNGYSPLVEKHYAYVGRWLGTFGSLPLDSFVNKPFFIFDNTTNEKVYEGEITWAKEKDEIFSGQTIKCLLNGESTLLLNFTSLQYNNNYKNKLNNLYIYIPGMGRSLPFSFNHKSVFNAFYTHMKGFYHQRTGIEHEKPYTNWEFSANHKGIYVAHHIPNNGHYSKYIFFENGTVYSKLQQFDMIKATKTDEFWEDVYGGHADAGDYDNRPYHLKIIDNLAAVYFFNKDKLKDRQLNIPESGNGVPDILSEMEWQLELHYRIQKKFNNGGVSTWVESTSHPTGTYTERYYTGLETREDTLNYVEAAGMLAICFKYCNTCDKSHYIKWKESALWAWEFAKKEENQCVYSFNYTIDGEIYNLTYIEPTPDDTMFTKAALVIYNLTENEEDTFPYIFNDITELKSENKRFYSGMLKLTTNLRNSGALDAFPLVLYKEDEKFDLIIKKLTDAIQRTVKIVLTLQEDGNYTYRNAYFYDKSHIYYASLGWGNFNGGPELEYLVMACHLIPEKKDIYLQSISYYYDFSMGCNHVGRSFTTGLGHFYPVRLVSCPFWDFLFNHKIYDPQPGITLYTFTGQIEYESIIKVHMFDYSGRKEFGNEQGYHKFISPFLANETFNNESFSIDYNNMRKILLEKIPFWRRGTNLEGLTIASSEFTVYETNIQMAMCTGMLLGADEDTNNCENYKQCPSIFPSDDLINKRPKNPDEFKDVLGRWSIP